MSTNTILVKIGSKNCQPCKVMDKMISENELPVDEIQMLDVDENKEWAQENNIRSVPTLILYRDGTEVKRKTGIMDLKQLQDWLEN